MTEAPCAYVYCQAPVATGDAQCRHCGYPVDSRSLDDREVVLNALPTDLPEAMIDMHQIVPKREGAWTLQLELNRRLNIEQLLLQSVPDKVSSLSNNADLRRLRQRHPELLISQFADPRQPFARRRISRYARDRTRVIKLLPCLGYQPDDRRFDKFWAALESQEMIAMIHTGFITARHKQEERRSGVFLNSRFGRPIYFDRIARQFPGLRLILCHMGGGAWYEEAAQMVTQHDNVWGDVAGPGIAALRRLLEQRVDVDWSRVFWGNDSSPACYGYNLRLLRSCLQQVGRLDLLDGLLYRHGKAFCVGAELIDA